MDLKWYRIHDIINLIILPVVFAANVRYLYTVKGSVQADTWYWVQFWVFLAYIIFDTVFIAVIPRCVASPTTIILHHLVCVVGWSLPALYIASGTGMPDSMKYGRFVAYGALVEFNTFFLIFRRNFRNVYAATFLFRGSWLCLRLLMYPYKSIEYLLEYYYDYIGANGQGDVPILATVILVLMLALDYLNFKWTYDLVSKELKKIHNGEEKGEISKGL